MPGTKGLSAAAAPVCSFTTVLMVNAASEAVIGLPSVHTAPDLSLNVHVRPSSLVVQDSAKSGWGCSSLEYCARLGYISIQAA